MGSPHFGCLSTNLLRLLEEGLLLDVEIKTSEEPVYLHKAILSVFSASILEKYKDFSGIWKLDASGYSASIVSNLVRLLYHGETDPSETCSEIIHKLNLDLSVDQRIRKKKVSKSKGEKMEDLIKLELKYLRDLTFEMGIAKLLIEPRVLTDVGIRTGKDVHRCHKIILSATSEYFAAMFSSGMRETEDDIIHLQGVETESFKIVLNYIYTGKHLVNMGNAKEILATAVYLQILKLQILCEDFMLQNIDVKNCIDILKVADVYGCDNLTNGSIAYITSQFSAIARPKLVKNLKPKELLKILSDDNLNSESENDVLSFVLEWLAYNQKENSTLSTLQQVRLDLVDDKLLQRAIKHNKMIASQPECIKMLQKALDLQQTGRVSSQPRKEETFIVLRRSSETKLIDLACYSLSRKTWYKLTTFPAHCGNTGVEACCTKDEIYMSEKLFYKYSVNENTWTSLPCMIENRFSHKMAIVNNMIYVFGGICMSDRMFLGTSSIEKYDIAKQQWTKVGDLAIPTIHSACAVVKTSILIFGGSIASKGGIPIKDIQCFDTVTETCTTLYHNLPCTLSLASACVHNQDIYITCVNERLIHYNMDSPPSYITPSQGSQYTGFDTLYKNNTVYVFGGYSTNSESDTIRTWDLAKKTYSVFREAKLPFSKQLNQLFVSRMYVSRKFLNEVYMKDESPRS